MGCWNGTCMLSNLPILHGDRVKLVILEVLKDEAALSSSGFCYSNSFYRPYALPITGSYNDYGLVEDVVEDWNLEFIMNALKGKLGTLGIYRDDKREFVEQYTIYDVLRGIERGKLVKHVKNGNEIETEEVNSFGFVMIREEIWDEVSQMVGAFDVVWNRQTVIKEGDPYYITGQRSVDLYYEDYIRCIRACIDKALANGHSAKHAVMFRHDFFLDFDRNMFLTSYQVFALSTGHLYQNKLLEHIDDSNFLESIKNMWGDYYKVILFMENTRRSWMIQSGAGSQDRDTKLYKYFTAITNIAIDRIDKKYGEEEEDDDE